MNGACNVLGQLCKGPIWQKVVCRPYVRIYRDLLLPAAGANVTDREKVKKETDGQNMDKKMDKARNYKVYIVASYEGQYVK